MPNHKAYQHHCRAADHYDHAAKYHRRTAKLFSEGQFEQAAEHALIAHRHQMQGNYHSEEATRARHTEVQRNGEDDLGPGYFA